MSSQRDRSPSVNVSAPLALTRSSQTLRLPKIDEEARGRLMAYRAPFLIDKLMKDRIVSTRRDGEVLFDELKKYLVMNSVDSSKLWQMHSLQIDFVWHEFVLFTREYRKFCDAYLGVYFPHSPANAPTYEVDNRWSPATFEEFKAHYESLFGELPALWYDSTHVHLHRRVVMNNDDAPMIVAPVGDRVELASARRIFVRVDAWAGPALHFMLNTGAFYVRELPNPLVDEDRVDLCRTLLVTGALRLAT